MARYYRNVRDSETTESDESYCNHNMIVAAKAVLLNTTITRHVKMITLIPHPRNIQITVTAYADVRKDF